MQNVSIPKRSILYILKKYLESLADIKVEQNDTMLIKSPYLILPNHSNNLDPFLVNIYVNRPIEYVTSDEYFRKFMTRNLLKYTGAIPKRKFIKDTAVIKEIILRVKKDKVIGIFPEGRRNWDGRTEKLIESTAKLIKLLKIPVVLTTLKGAYLSYPRWAKHSRWGKINISYKLILTPEEIKEMSSPDIYQYLQNEFCYDEYNYQDSEMNIYQGKKLAENLETFLFICPNCLSVSSLTSKDNKLSCMKCKNTVTYNKYGYFDYQSNSNLTFENPRDWNIWQLTQLEKVLNNDLQLYDNDIKLIKLNQDKKFKIIDTGGLKNNSADIIFKGKNKVLIQPGKIYGLNIQYNNILEFYYEEELYRFIFDKKRQSAFKWLQIFEYFRKGT